ncbi:MAG: (d)CMP kinase [Nanoarchaeota archaeon]|nr:(d)CMP kinase [Nanoarchaeota archaeon]
MEKKMVIAIDGSACTGKSSSAKILAKLLGYQYLNTGAMFRGVAYYVHNKGLTEEKQIKEAIKNITMEFKDVQGESHLFLNGEDITEQTKQKVSTGIIPLTSRIASIPTVRQKLLELQRQIAREGGYIVEGRDTGTAVFPDADWKFFLDASMEVKTKRLFKLLSPEEKKDLTPDEARKIIEDIDTRDQNREVGPLVKAKDAILYDNSDSPSADQDAIVMWYYITKKDEMRQNVAILDKKS